MAKPKGIDLSISKEPNTNNYGKSSNRHDRNAYLCAMLKLRCSTQGRNVTMVVGKRSAVGMLLASSEDVAAVKAATDAGAAPLPKWGK